VNRKLLTRLLLAYLAVTSLFVGVWAQVAPRSFYDRFPGFGHVWVGVDGPYNEHLLRDVGGLNLALAIVIIAAAVTLSRRAIVTAALAALAYGIPHVSYHLSHTDGIATGDVVSSVGGLVLFVAAALALLVPFSGGRVVDGSLQPTMES
jgi:hypothetical protein